MAKVIRTKLRDGRRLPSNEPRAYEIAEMRASHFQMVTMFFFGRKIIDIAADLERTPQNVSDVLNSDIAKAHLYALQEARDNDSVSVSKQLKELAPDALALIRTSMDRTRMDMLADPDKKIDKLHEEIAFKVLDRTGHGVPKEQKNLHLHLSSDQLSEIKSYNPGKEEAVTAEVISE